jgi:5S rRNA maturation endonuclease (ribonuclease M5)
LSTGKERKLELLTGIICNLIKKSENKIILVEGKKDRGALKKLGIRGKILCVKNSSNILSDYLDFINDREVILLLDFDDYGTALSKKIAQYLEEKRVKANTAFWRKIKTCVRRDVKDVEGIPSFLEKLKKSL